MDGTTTTILLRLIHILAGIFWVGAVFVMAGFLVPTVRETGREGGRFMQHLAQRRRLPVVLSIAMLLTMLSGFAMYARLAASTHGQWASTRPGIGYGVGALAAILAAITGATISGSARGGPTRLTRWPGCSSGSTVWRERARARTRAPASALRW